ncbi:MAG: hypothetical protein MJ174_07400 [Treponema sp.]|nr:hypothetical protein [Treponema sp.]
MTTIKSLTSFGVKAEIGEFDKTEIFCRFTRIKDNRQKMIKVKIQNDINGKYISDGITKYYLADFY